MIKLFKSPFKYLATIIALSLIVIASCKKDSDNDNLTETQRIANAKNWYQKTTAKIELKAGKKVENVSQEISWDNAKLYKQADGNEIIGVPVDIKLNNGTKTKGSYLLMISKIGGTYKPVISFNEQKNYFVENIVTSKIKDWYNDATKPNNSHKNTLLNNTGKDKVMVVPGGNMDCTEWFLTETYYDDEGNVIQYYEHYMYTICQGLIDGGGSEDEEKKCQNISESLSSILKSGESIQTCVSVPSNSLAFTDLSALRNAMDSQTLSIESATSSGDEIIIPFKTTNMSYGGVLIKVKIKKNTSNIYEVKEITSDTWGNSFSWTWHQGIYSVNVLHNIITVDLHGTKKWNIFFEGAGTLWSQELKYRMTIDKTTGQPTSFSPIN